MKINDSIKFSNLNKVLLVKKGDKHYNELNKINLDGFWTEYVNEMLKNKISVRYDYPSDSFLITPIEQKLRENFIPKKYLGFDDDYNDEPNINVVDVNQIKDIFNDVFDEKINDGFAKLKNDIYSELGEIVSFSKEKDLNLKTLNFIKSKEECAEDNDDKLLLKDNEDDELLLKGYDYVSAFNDKELFPYLETEEENVHPNLKRVLKPIDVNKNKSDNEEIFLFDQESSFNQEKEQKLTTIKQDREILGNKVKIVLIELELSEEEIEHIVFEALKHNLSINDIVGKNNKLHICLKNQFDTSGVVEIDDENEVNPYSVGHFKFKNLNEAYKHISKKKG